MIYTYTGLSGVFGFIGLLLGLFIQYKMHKLERMNQTPLMTAYYKSLYSNCVTFSNICSYIGPVYLLFNVVLGFLFFGKIGVAKTFLMLKSPVLYIPLTFSVMYFIGNVIIKMTRSQQYYEKLKTLIYL